MELNGRVALVTGANRGLGQELARELVRRGVKVYAGARKLETVTLDGVMPIEIDITDPHSVARAAEVASDVSILINNAGLSTGADFLTGSDDDIQLEMATNYFGTVNVGRKFAPVLNANGGGAMLNVLSVLSWFTLPGAGAYSASKSAAWSLTNALRQELAAQGTLVSALHVSYMDTDMTEGLEVPKLDPADVAKLAVDGLEAGQVEILADDISRQVQQGLGGGVAALYPVG